jgi:hypothetical protein
MLASRGMDIAGMHSPAKSGVELQLQPAHVHAELQHTEPTQKVVAHWFPPVHAWPMGNRARHTPLLQ